MADGFICRQTVEMTRDNAMLLRRQPILKGDKNALTWRVMVMRYGAPCDLTGATADLYCARACDAQDGTSNGTVYTEATITDAAGGVVEAVLPPDAANVPGPVVCMLRIKRSGAVVGIARMAVDAVDPVGSDIVDEGNRILDLGALVEAAERCESAAAAADEAAQRAQNAVSSAVGAAQAANTAAGSATRAASRANAAADAVEGLTATAQTLDTGQAATASVTVVDGHYQIALGLPRGLTGATPQITLEVATGEPGTEAAATVTGTAEEPHILLTIPRGRTGNIGELKINGIAPGADGSVTLTAESIGARPDDWMPSAQDVGAVSMALLWKNESPSSPMDADASGVSGITLDWATLGFTHVLVTYVYGISGTNAKMKSGTISEIEIGKGIMLSINNAGSDAYANRLLEFTDAGLHIGGGSKCVSGKNENSTASSNVIPLKVYGIKGVIANG